MERQQYLVIAAAFFLATGTGFIAHQIFQGQSNQKFSSDLSLEVNSEQEIASTEFDGNFLELRYEDSPKAKFYFKFNDTRDVQQIQNLKQDGTLQTATKIRSFGNETYFLYLRYQDNPNQTEDAFMRLYRIEEA